MKKGQKVKVIELPLPQGLDHQNIDVLIGELAVVNYIDGCCLSVTTDRGVEYTANASRFESI